MYWYDVSLAVLILTVVVFLICATLTEIPCTKRYLTDNHFKLYDRINKLCRISGVIIAIVLVLALISYLILIAYGLLTGVISIKG